VERGIYRVCRVDPEREQRWNVYALSLLAFSLVSGLVLYVQLRLQGHLPLNPDHMKAVPPALSFNTAMSFLTNTNWQNYSGESTMAHLTQMAGLAVHNFVSAAVGATVAVALIRGLVRRQSDTLGNFWVDLTRTTTRLLLPIASWAPGCCSARAPSRTSTPRAWSPPWRGPSSRSRAGPSPARRRSRTPGRTAAGPTTPTRPTPTRTPTRSPIC